MRLRGQPPDCPAMEAEMRIEYVAFFGILWCSTSAPFADVAFSLFLIVSHCFSIVSHCFSSFLIVSHCFPIQIISNPKMRAQLHKIYYDLLTPKRHLIQDYNFEYWHQLRIQNMVLDSKLGFFIRSQTFRYSVHLFSSILALSDYSHLSVLHSLASCHAKCSLWLCYLWGWAAWFSGHVPAWKTIQTTIYLLFIYIYIDYKELHSRFN